MTEVLSARAESAVSLIFQTLGGHKTTMLTIRSSKHAMRLAPPQLDLEQIHFQATLLRLVSIAESFCAARLLACAESTLPAGTGPVVAVLWEDAALEATKTWESQKQAFRKWFDVKPDWTRVDGLAEARNAIAHGLGTLTRRQLKSRQSTLTKLDRTGICLAGDRLILTDGDLSRAAAICRDIITEVDGLLLTRVNRPSPSAP